MTALGLTLWDPSRFLAADHYGGFAVALMVIFIGIRIARDTSARLTDAMPNPNLLDQIRQVARNVPGTARNTGLQYHVDLHLEVDPEMRVRQAHDIANEVRFAIRRQVSSVAGVLVRLEPVPGSTNSESKQ